MKKNISINISGIIFHIEEDGYELLKGYLESINQYFASFDDNQEIIADIESRIAEIFLAKLNEEKQVITQNDVEDLKATMGSVKDFQAVEEPNLEEESHKQTSGSSSTAQQGSKRLYRDNKRKVLGGVCAGLGHYFGIDPLWLRLLFLLLAFPSGGLVALAYIVMWAVLPVSQDIEEDKDLKKMFRNPEDKVLGGVASGMAAYFGIEASVMRILFVLLVLLAGTGVIAYIVLWIILPEASSITEKVQMKGDPVTLTNIESNIKKNLKVDESADENIYVKVLLFPFRLIGIIFSGIGRAVGPILLFLLEAIRVIFGLVLTLTGLSMILAFVITTGILLGIFAGGTFLGFDAFHADFPYNLLSDSISAFSILAAFLAAAIPSFFMIILGISIAAKRTVINSTVGWSLFALWILGLIGLSITVPSTIYQFRENGEYREVSQYSIVDKTAVIKINEVGYESYDAVSLTLRGYNESKFKLIQEFESRGRSRREAIENAKMVDYDVILEDSVFTFDSNITFRSNAKFRGQDLSMILYIPYNQPFKMEYALRHIIRNTIYRHGYSTYDMGVENTWIFTPAGLECITCEKEVSSYEKSYRYRYGEHSRIFDNTDFSSVLIGNAFDIEIDEGEEYRVTIVGSEDDVDEVVVLQDGDELVIRYDKESYDIRERKRSDVKVKILMPNLNNLSLSGVTKSRVSGFDGEKLEIELSGASYCTVDSDYQQIDASISGASELELRGEGQELAVEINGASKLSASNFMVNYADIRARGLSNAYLYVTDQLHLDASMVSNVKYKGGAELVKETTSGE